VLVALTGACSAGGPAVGATATHSGGPGPAAGLGDGAVPAGPLAEGTPTAQDPPTTRRAPVVVPVAVPATRLAVTLSRVGTSQPVVFLGVDDGYVRSRWLLALEQQRHLPFTAFLTNAAWRQDPGYWRQLQAAGVRIEDHTLTHPLLTGLAPAQVRRQICVAATADTTAFGRRPVLFRPPYGGTNAVVRRAAAGCGMRAVVLWDVTVNRGALQYVAGRRHLQAGDIVLMHFRPEMQQDMTAFLRQAAADDLAVAGLENYLTPGR